LSRNIRLFKNRHKLRRLIFVWTVLLVQLPVSDFLRFNELVNSIVKSLSSYEAFLINFDFAFSISDLVICVFPLKAVLEAVVIEDLVLLALLNIGHFFHFIVFFTVLFKGLISFKNAWLVLA
jgi:hypothetical protein